MTKLPPSFFLGRDVTRIARNLVGKILLTSFDNHITSGRIVETEAYNGVVDRASHAWNNRRTARTEVMFGNGGTAYVYLCYGIHHLFNIVTGKAGQPHAVLIRGVEPLEGISVMRRRLGLGSELVSGKTEVQLRKERAALGRGPGKLTRSLGIHTGQSGWSLQEHISIWDDGFRVKAADIGCGPRIGVDYAGTDALLPYRFYLRGYPAVSGPRNGNL